MSIALSVNLNKIALLRNSRETPIPDLCQHANICLAAGAQGITVHPRPDQRHIRAQDCFELAAFIRSDTTGIEYNIEGNPFAEALCSDRWDVSDYPGFMALVEDIKPDQCTLVPDTNSQLTSDHGFDLIEQGNELKPVIARLRSLGIRVSLFMDPDLQQIELARGIGADRIELYTGPYAESYGTTQQEEVLARFRKAAEFACDIGLGVNAGHDLNLDNLACFAGIPGLREVSIGHALIADALTYGLHDTVKRYLACLT